MNAEILKLVKTLKNREHHVIAVTGNIYDFFRFGNETFDGCGEFLNRLTEKKFPQCLTYDIASGVKISRGDKKVLAKEMGLETAGAGGENADLINALKKAKLAANESNLPVNPTEAFSGFDRIFREGKTPTAVFIDFAHTLFPGQIQNLNRERERAIVVALLKWAKDGEIRRRGHLIVLFTHRASELDQSILDRSFEIVQIRIGKPDESARMAFLAELAVKTDFVPVFAKAGAGLSFKELNKLALTLKDVSDLSILLDSVFRLKAQALKDEYGDVLQIMETRLDWSCIGGLERPIEKLQRVAEAMKTGEASLVPQGIMFMGPPGTGKTILAEAFAKEAGLNFVKPLDIKSMWLGESERRMTRFIEAINDLSPVVVFIDEFDQNQGQRGGFDGDSGTSRNLFKKMLEVMSDISLRGRILWILASNRPDLIDPAMKRPGRCDLRIPFLPPDEGQLALIAGATFRQYPDMKSGIRDWRLFARKCAGYTGADMVEVVRRAWERARYSGKSVIAAGDMEWAIGDFIPQRTDERMIGKMTLLALADCSSRELLPSNYKEVIERYKETLGESAKGIVFFAAGELPDSDIPDSGREPTMN